MLQPNTAAIKSSMLVFIFTWHRHYSCFHKGWQQPRIFVELGNLGLSQNFAKLACALTSQSSCVYSRLLLHIKSIWLCPPPSWLIFYVIFKYTFCMWARIFHYHRYTTEVGGQGQGYESDDEKQPCLRTTRVFEQNVSTQNTSQDGGGYDHIPFYM